MYLDKSGTERVTVEEAARTLGIKEESVRKRVHRGKLPWEKGTDGRLFVWVDKSQTVRDESKDESIDRSGTERVEEMRERIADLKEQLDQEREARRRADTIIAQLSQANAEMARTVRALEAPPSPERPPDGPETAGEAQGSTMTPEAHDEPETETQRRSWWRRLIGR